MHLRQLLPPPLELILQPRPFSFRMQMRKAECGPEAHDLCRPGFILGLRCLKLFGTQCQLLMRPLVLLLQRVFAFLQLALPRQALVELKTQTLVLGIQPVFRRRELLVLRHQSP